MVNYSKTMTKYSNLSIELLKSILKNYIVKIDNNGIIYVNGIKLLNNNKILLLFNNQSKKLRRKYKNDYEYFNIFGNRKHFDMILDLFFENNTNIDYLEIEKITNFKYSFTLKKNNNLKNKKFIYLSVNNERYAIIKYLLYYYNLI